MAATFHTCVLTPRDEGYLIQIQEDLRGRTRVAGFTDYRGRESGLAVDDIFVAINDEGLESLDFARTTSRFKEGAERRETLEVRVMRMAPAPRRQPPAAAPPRPVAAPPESDAASASDSDEWRPDPKRARTSSPSDSDSGGGLGAADFVGGDSVGADSDSSGVVAAAAPPGVADLLAAAEAAVAEEATAAETPAVYRKPLAVQRRWTVGEDDALRSILNGRGGPGLDWSGVDWSGVAAELARQSGGSIPARRGGVAVRDAADCRDRFVNVLSKGVRKGRFSEVEDARSAS